jgi:hypothetical protein
MNLLLRTVVFRQTPLFTSRRYLSTEKFRRAFRSSLVTDKLRSPVPRPNNQRPLGYINEKNVIFGIIAINGAVFVIWRFSYANLQANHNDRLLWFMTKNFSMCFKLKK